ncbi:MAG: hypothetical protein LBQ20_07755 [Rhodanobacter sp.]|jgi:hypothetical protein|nr:hypothetical protein [Rhodanobacter sp.]
MNLTRKTIHTHASPAAFARGRAWPLQTASALALLLALAAPASAQTVFNNLLVGNGGNGSNDSTAGGGDANNAGADSTGSLILNNSATLTVNVDMLVGGGGGGGGFGLGSGATGGAGGNGTLRRADDRRAYPHHLWSRISSGSLHGTGSGITVIAGTAETVFTGATATENHRRTGGHRYVRVVQTYGGTP